MAMLSFSIFIISICPLLLHSFRAISLNGKWNIHNNAGVIKIVGNVPGNVHTALWGAGKIQDPYWRFNDIDYSWIGEENWIYRRTFYVDEELLRMNHLTLRPAGLDSVGSIKLNNRTVYKFDNMFVAYNVDVKSALKMGNNSLSIIFYSPVKVAKYRAQRLKYIIPPECPVSSQHGRCHVNMVRKQQSSFSWDWGPSFPTSGIWKDIDLLAYNCGVVQYVTAETLLNNSNWSVVVEIFIASYFSSLNVSLEITLNIGTKNITAIYHVSTKGKNPTIQKTLIIPKSDKVKLWWPSGYGEQHLHRMNVVVNFIDCNEIYDREINLGFRTVELIQDPISGKDNGLTFYFKINGVPIFLKGSNWVPVDSFQDRVTSERVTHLLRSVVDANMNALRIWGGGVYESDMMYNLADQLGILIWQDFMFACAMYPSDSAFLKSVKKEISHQVKRLKHHPSILVWAGSNENEAALAENWYNTSSHYTRYYQDYMKLYVHTIRPTVQELDRSRPFLISSPSNGKETHREHWLSKDPQNQKFGDVHFYSDKLDLWNVTNFPVPRMSTEYGCQSWCSFSELENVTLVGDRQLFSDWSVARQHKQSGNTVLLQTVLRHFAMPKLFDKEPETFFRHFIYLSQIDHAMTYRIETEHYRRHQCTLSRGYGLTMGALYWQLNDVWQAPSLSSIDYSGRWKMLHYFAKHFFAPYLISPYISKGILRIYLITQLSKKNQLKCANIFKNKQEDIWQNSFQDFILFKKKQTYTNNRQSKAVEEMDIFHSKSFTCKNVTLVIKLFRWSCMKSLTQIEKSVQLTHLSQEVYSISVKQLTHRYCQSVDSCFLYFTIKESSDFQPTWLPLSNFRQSYRHFPKASITISQIRMVDHKTFTIDIVTNAIAIFVWLESSNVVGRFSDNGFLLISYEFNLTFYSLQPTSEAELSKSLRILHLMDLY